MEKEKTIEVLNTLIEINNDRIEGYNTALKETDETDFKSLFAQLAHTSQKCKSELVFEVKNLGGTPIEGTRTSGKFYRAWMDFKSAVTGHDRETILNSCEYGESVANDTYKDVLDNNTDDLTSEQQAIIKTQYMLLKADYDKVKEMLAALEQT